jgi:hypothetical protein
MTRMIQLTAIQISSPHPVNIQVGSLIFGVSGVMGGREM